MSLGGSLREMPLTELLLFLGRSQVDGKLTLTAVDIAGLVVFRQGRVIYAASTSVRETLGSVLVARGLFGKAVLLQALERQHRERADRRLGAILVEMGALQQEALDQAVRDQLGVVMGELLRWREGYFRFEPVVFGARGEVGVDARDFLLDEGIDPERLADEAAAARARDPLADLLAEATGVVPRAPTRAAAATASAPAGAPVNLHSVISHPAAPWLTAEVGVAIMDCAARTLRRCVLFGVRGDRLVGMGGFGLGSGHDRADSRIRAVAVAADAPSVLAFALGTGETYHGPVHDTPGDRDLVAQLGGEMPREIVVVPLRVRGRAVAVLYGDNGPAGGPVGPTADLERVVAEACETMASAMAPADEPSVP